MHPNAIFQISSEETFQQMALATFRYQYEHVSVYREFCNHLNKNPENVRNIEAIPFLPIEFFKSFEVISNEQDPSITFTSSGTTGSSPSKHYVAQLSLYEQSFRKGFAHCYGNPKDWVILALLPAYLEREGSSLVYMVDQLIKDSQHTSSGFYLHNYDALVDTLKTLEAQGQQTLLIGVSFALLDLTEMYHLSLQHTTIMETGGMKGRRKELVREALHEHLTKGFGVPEIHSEYGMTELLSQAYSQGGGRFTCPPWMKVITRDPEDPFQYIKGKTGGINVIDLANYYSCSFIATQDLGKVHADHSFEILGRFDHSDIRGCNLMVL